MPSKEANQYETTVEYHLIDERDLQLARSSWHDSIFPSTGTPVETKSCDVGSTGYFQIYKKYHRKLVRAGGWYGFVVYRGKMGFDHRARNSVTESIKDALISLVRNG